MRTIGAISTAVLALSLGVAAPAYAQQEQHEQQEEQKEKPAEQKEKKPQAEKPVKPEEKSVTQEKNRKPEQKPEEKNVQQHAQPAHPQRQEQHAGRIPDDRYRANFGQAHTFRVSQGDYRNHRFQYGGYWFGFAAPWPSNWLYTQNVFVVEIDGVYYLCNPMYPGVNVALNVTL
jgi:hypothetical protein